MAYRPAEGPLVLNRLDFSYEAAPLAEARSGTAHGALTIVNNTIVNLTPRPDLQLSLQLGFKVATDMIDERRYSTFPLMTGAESRIDLGERIDIGLRASTLASWPSGIVAYSAGPSVGYSITEAI